MATTTTTLSPSMVTFYQRQILPIVQTILLWGMFGMVGRIPAKNGKVSQWRKYAVLAEAPQLAEGVVPTGKSLSQTQVTATRKAYGDFVAFTDESVELTIDEVMEDSIPIIADQIGRTQDGEHRQILTSGTTVRYVGGHTDRDEVTGSDILTWDFLRTLHKDMTKRKVPRFTQYGGTYVLIVGPEGKLQLMKDAEFKSVVHSNTSDPQRRAELNQIGTFAGWTVFETNNPAEWEDAGAGGAVDVRAAVALGRDAYGVSVWQDPKLIIKEFGSAGTSDPVDQLATVGWKAAWVTVILQELWIERIEHA